MQPPDPDKSAYSPQAITSLQLYLSLFQESVWLSLYLKMWPCFVDRKESFQPHPVLSLWESLQEPWKLHLFSNPSWKFGADPFTHYIYL